MNVDNNKLFHDTEQKIFLAYKQLVISKGLKKITVRDICQNAQIHRTTFYRHFQDIPALQRHIDQMHLEDIFKGFVNNGQWNLREGIVNQLKLFSDNRAVILRNLSLAELQERLEIYISGNLIDKYIDSYMKKYHCESINEALYHRDFFSAGFSALVSKWITGGCQDSPELIGKYICKFFDL